MKKILRFLFLFMLTATSIAGAQTKIASFLDLNDKKYDNVLVDQVLSADMIRVAIDGTNERIKLIGLKAPNPPKRKTIERDKNGFLIEKTPSAETPIEERAFDFAKKLLEKKAVRLEFDNELRDDEGSKLAYVFLIENDLFINAEILRQGYAFLSINPANSKYAEELRAAYREARKELRGLQSE